MDFAQAYLMCKLGHPELAGWWGKLLGGGSGGGGSGGGGGSDDDGGSKPFDQLTWDQVIASTKTGKYKTFTGAPIKELDLGPEGIVHMQIAGIDEDDLADGSGKAPLTFISKELLATKHNMNSSNTSIGGWESTAMRTYLKNTIKPLIPAAVAAGIKEVTKYSKSVDPANKNATTTDDVWIPSAREIFGGTSYESSGPVYTDLFDSASARIKNLNGGASKWWLRTAYRTAGFRYVGSNGDSGSDFGANSALGVALGFCL